MGTEVMDILARELESVCRSMTARNDRRLLREANRIYKLFRSEVRDTSLHDFVTDQHDNLVVYVKDRWVGDEPLVFVIAWNGKRVLHTVWMGKGLIEIGLKQFSPWRDVETVKEVVELIGNNKRAVIHEIVHELDRRRIKGWSKLPYHSPTDEPQGGSRYLNQPQEMNAYFLQALDKGHSEFDEIMDDVKSSNENKHQSGVWRLYDWVEDYGKDFKGFLRGFWSRMGKRRSDLLSPKTKRNFNKRVYDYWRKASKEANEVFQDLLVDKDQMALLMVA